MIKLHFCENIYLHGCSHCVLSSGKHNRRNAAEDLFERSCLIHRSRSRSLLLHARVLNRFATLSSDDRLRTAPILYRYTDWSITVSWQVVELYLILSVVNEKIGSGLFFRFFCGTVVM